MFVQIPAQQRDTTSGGPLAGADANRLARAIQSGVPFAPRPWDSVARDLGLSSRAVLDQLRAWESEGTLREISAVLEGSALGHDSALVAGAVPVARLEEVASIVSACPTVTHNYLREHALNLWFTISVPREWGLDRVVRAISRETGVHFRALPRTHTFKIGVNFDLEARSSSTEVVELPSAAPIAVSRGDARRFRALQSPLPLIDEPFQALARIAETDGDELIEFARRHAGGAIRRYMATFRHRKLGVNGNGMAVWRVPEDSLESLGRRVAESPEVTHCYARVAIDGFPYRLYSMLHGPDEASVRRVAARIAGETGAEPPLLLFSTREYKKCRLRYFLPETEAWWHARAGEA